MLLNFSNGVRQFLTSGGSRISQTGAPTPQGVEALTYYLASFHQKLHENETIWAERDGRRAGVEAPPPDPPMLTLDSSSGVEHLQLITTVQYSIKIVCCSVTNDVKSFHNGSTCETKHNNSRFILGIVVVSVNRP